MSRKGADDKWQITATLAETLSGEILPFQLIYKGKTKRSVPSSKFPAGFLLSANPRHWSHEETEWSDQAVRRENKGEAGS